MDVKQSLPLIALNRLDWMRVRWTPGTFQRFWDIFHDLLCHILLGENSMPEGHLKSTFHFSPADLKGLCEDSCSEKERRAEKSPKSKSLLSPSKMPLKFLSRCARRKRNWVNESKIICKEGWLKLASLNVQEMLLLRKRKHNFLSSPLASNGVKSV